MNVRVVGLLTGDESSSLGFEGGTPLDFDNCKIPPIRQISVPMVSHPTHLMMNTEALSVSTVIAAFFL